MDKSLHKKLSFSLRIFSVNVYFLETFSEEILNGKLHFLCSESSNSNNFKYGYMGAAFNL